MASAVCEGGVKSRGGALQEGEQQERGTTAHLGVVQAIGVVVVPVGLSHPGCGPVVAVQDVGLPVGAQQELERGLAEKIKANLV